MVGPQVLRVLTRMRGAGPRGALGGAGGARPDLTSGPCLRRSRCRRLAPPPRSEGPPPAPSGPARSLEMGQGSLTRAAAAPRLSPAAVCRQWGVQPPVGDRRTTEVPVEAGVGAAEEQRLGLVPQACALRNGRRGGRASPLNLCNYC